MTLAIDTQDLINFPGTIKRVGVTISQIVPTGRDGDEKYTLSFSTNAFAENELKTKIQALYITNIKNGWIKSSGLAGSSGRFNLTPTANKLRVSLDNASAGPDGGYYTVELDYNENSSSIPGELVALDLQKKIRTLADNLSPNDEGYRLCFKNASVYFRNNRFLITSGTLSDTYVGNTRSSVTVLPALEDDASQVLGFDLHVSSIKLSNDVPTETLLGENYTQGSSVVSLVDNIGFNVGDAFIITDGVNRDYFTAITKTSDRSMTVATTSTNSFVAIKNSYEKNKSKIQKLSYQDIENIPDPILYSVDDVIRFGLRSMMSQIDYTG